ncbi:hypothetical protein L7F22_035776 [Adiantum nelumboides]|nr:hypothetical protein [Adiantum nelumboides]
MGQHQNRPRPHPLSNASHTKKLLIWSAGIVLPFLLLVCIFPWGGAADIYKPSVNRIIVSQFQIPHVQSGGLIQSKLPSDDNPPVEASDGDDGSGGDNADAGKADNQQQATRTQLIPNETAATSIADLSLSTAEKQKQESTTKLLNADEGILLSKTVKKQSDGGMEKKHNDEHENSKPVPRKAKKLNDEDDDSTLFELKHAPKDEEKTKVRSIDADASNKTEKQKQHEADSSARNAFIKEREIDGQDGEPSESKKQKKKSTKKEKTMKFSAEAMPEIELDEEFLIPGKNKETVEPSLAEVESKKSKKTHDTDESDLNVEENTIASKSRKSSKKAKAMRDTDVTDLNEEDFIAKHIKGDEDEVGSFIKRENAFADELEDEKFLEENPLTSFRSTSSKQSSRKTMGMSYNDKKNDEEEDAEQEVSFSGKRSRSRRKAELVSTEEEDGFWQRDRKAKFFAKMGKSSDDDGDGERSSADEHSSDLLFLKSADEEAFLSGFSHAKKKQKKVPASAIDLDDNSPDFEEMDGKEGQGKRKAIEKKKIKDDFAEEEYSFDTQKHGDGEEALDTLWEDDEEFSQHVTRKQRKGSRKVGNMDSDFEFDENEEASGDDSMESSRAISKTGGCNYLKGRWIKDSNDPPYSDLTCPWKFVNDDQSCKTTSKSKNWRWNPSECSIKRFKVAAFLKLMKGKAMAFVGDKMVKAQMKSLICLLAEVEDPTLLYDDKSNQSLSWHFSSSNVTISLIWSPYLVQHTNEYQYSKLWLDKLDTKWAVMVPTLDVLILGVGASFVRPSLYTVRNSVVGCYSCQSLSSNIDITNLKEISLYSGFRASMRSSILGIGALPGFNGVALFLQPFGFEGNRSYASVSAKMKDIQDQELQKAKSKRSISNQSIIEVLHTHLISENDYDPIKGLCKPSCLIPNPLADTWNQVLQHTLTCAFILESDT